MWYRALCQHGIPKRILSDKGTQFRSAHRIGEADFEYYSKVLGIRVIHHKKRNPKCKGKIERLFEFIQRDFVLENLDLETVEEVNLAFWKWINQYNHKHRSRTLQRKTPRSRYRPSNHRKSPKELEYLICYEEPRRVHRDGFISYYGNLYRVPYEYIKAPPLAGVKLKGDTLFIECGKKTIAKHKLIP